MSIWTEQFETQCKVRRAVILHGNVLDIFWKNQHKGINITQFIAGRLETIGYNDIVCWDINNGAGGLSSEAKKQLSDDINSTIVKPEDDPSEKGNDYNDLDIDMNTNIDIKESTADAASFFNILLKRFSNPKPNHKPTVYIIDGADALFGNANSLSEAERKLLLQLGSALRNSSCTLNVKDLTSRQDLIIIVIPRLALIPSRFYQDNPAVSDVFVSRPDRKDREDFLTKCTTSFLVKEAMHAGSSDFQECIDALENFTYRDIQQLVRLSQNIEGDLISYRRLINLYLYGEKKSPWEDLSRDRLITLDDELKRQVKGQDHVVERVVNVIKKAYMGLSGLQHSSRQQMPKGTLFFVGPTGVGKTEMAKSIARFLFGDEESCIRFDMSEYAAEHSDQRLVGAPPGYVGYEEGGQLTNAVKQRPFSVLLFDEIEKAHSKIFDKFLQILEDGRLTDGKGDTVSFSETVIVFTSNIGSSEVSPDDKNPHDSFREKVKAHFVNEMHRPELLNRIGETNIIPFNYLTDENVLLKIVASKLEPLRKKLQEKYALTFEIENQEDALKILMKGFNKQNGGRGIANRLNEEIIEPLANRLFDYEPDDLRGMTMVAKLHKTGNHFIFRPKD